MGSLIDSVLANDRDGLVKRLDQGADPNQRDREGRTPLIHATIDGKLELAGLLLAHGADINAQDALGYSALHYAAQNYLPELATLLISRGATVDLADHHGNTPLARATFESRGRGEMIAILLTAGANKNHANMHGQTPAGLAQLVANYELVKLFEDR